MNTMRTRSIEDHFVGLLLQKMKVFDIGVSPEIIKISSLEVQVDAMNYYDRWPLKYPSDRNFSDYDLCGVCQKCVLMK